jgi:hypothetical protein
MHAISATVASALGADRVTAVEHLQDLWGGYGEALRLTLDGGPVPSVVAKHVAPAAGRGRGHQRKLRSYDVETTWYRDHADRCGAACRVPKALHLASGGGRWLFVLEDLQASGLTGHRRGPRLDAMLRWLAAFHATFLGQRPRGLWRVGTYWHLATRPDEHRAMAAGPLRDAAAALDARLHAATYKTFVHGDAKPANFCQGPSGIAAVDFQYVGGGVGVKDVAYLLAGTDARTRDRGLDLYFHTLRAALDPDVDGGAVEQEWRALYPLAWADFQRFLAGWAPGWTIRPHEQALTASALRAL